MSDKSNTPLLVVNVVFSAFTLVLLFFIAKDSLLGVFLALGLTGLWLIFSRIWDRYKSRHTEPIKPLPVYINLRKSNVISEFGKLVINTIIIIVACLLFVSVLFFAKMIFLVLAILGLILWIIISAFNRFS